MGSGPIILDISSDEEDWGDAKGENSGMAGDRDDCNWIKEVFQEMNRETDVSDDVILVSGIIVKPKAKPPAKEMNDDDDCMILDGDPDQSISVENDSAVADSDDLLIVGAKGQIACRDFPHPRHLCANYEFATTPHEKYCSQCHCYVCDALAPCVHWGNGVSSVDHCHATEKHIYWKHERKKIKQGDKAPPQPPKLTDFYSMGREHLSPNIRSCSTTDVANTVTRFSRPIHPPGFPNTKLHHILGMRTPFKRPGGAVLANNRSGYEYMRLPSCVPESQPFQSTAFSLPETSQSFDHTLPFQSQVSSPLVNLLPTNHHESHSIMDESMNLVSSEPQILLNPFPSQPPQISSEQKNGENVPPFSQPESNLYVNSTFDINGLKVPQFGSDISHQDHDFSSPIYDPCFPNGNGSNSPGFDTDPWMFDQSLCSLPPVLDVVYRPESPDTLDTQFFFNL